MAIHPIDFVHLRRDAQSASPTKPFGVTSPSHLTQEHHVSLHQLHPPAQRHYHAHHRHHHLSASHKQQLLHHMQPLPTEIQQFKAQLMQKFPEKLVKFSFPAMRRVATPPVAIPEEYRGPRVLATCVSGRKVPFTKNMHDNQKRRAHRLDMIDEYVHYK